MNCIEFEAAVERAIEARQPLPLITLEHTANCAECRRVWEQQRQLGAAIVAWRTVMPRASFADAVLAELALPVRLDDQDVIEDFSTSDDEMDAGDSKPQIFTVPLRSVSAKESRSGVLAMVSVAACLCAAVIFTSQSVRRNHAPGQDLAKNRPAQRPVQVVVDAQVDVSGTLTAVFSDLQSEYREMASETTAVAREMVNAIPHPVAVSVLPGTDQIQLHPNPRDIGRMWQPIGASVESALGFLWQAVPSQLPSG